jgi:hypothetical protein
VSMNITLRSLRRPALFVSIVGAFVLGTILRAYGTAEQVTFFGCLTSGGTLIDVVTTPASPRTCPSGSTAVTWNQANAGGGGLSGLREFTANGSFVPPAGVAHVMVEAWGGGGGGAPESGCVLGGGGGSGGYVRGVVAVTPGQSYSVNVGSGGAPSTSGGDSGLSSQSVSLISAGGGGGAVSSTGGAGGLGNPAGGILRQGAAGTDGFQDPMCGFGTTPAGGTPVQGSVAVGNLSSGGAGGSGFNGNNPQTGEPGDVILTW